MELPVHELPDHELRDHELRDHGSTGPRVHGSTGPRDHGHRNPKLGYKCSFLSLIEDPTDKLFRELYYLREPPGSTGPRVHGLPGPRVHGSTGLRVHGSTSPGPRVHGSTSPKSGHLCSVLAEKEKTSNGLLTFEKSVIHSSGPRIATEIRGWGTNARS